MPSAFSAARRRARGTLSLVAAALAMLAFSGHTPAHANKYVFDKMHSEVRVSWDHLGLSRQAARFRDFEGSVMFDPAKPEEGSVEVTFKVGSISTGVRELDKQLTQTKDFFDVANYPTVTFKSTAARKIDDRTGEVVGDLTINGIAKPVTLFVTWNFLGDHPLSKFNPTYTDKVVAGFSAMTTLLRADWEMKRFIPLVSDELVVTIEVELIKQ